MEIDITIKGPVTNERADFVAALIAFIRQQTERETHLIVSTTEDDPCTYNVEFLGLLHKGR